MPIRPIDFQNILARVDFVSKRMSDVVNAKKIDEEIKNKNIDQQMNEIKDKVTKIDKIIDYENRIRRILNPEDKQKNKQGKPPFKKSKSFKEGKNKFYTRNSEDEENHIIDRKI